MDRFGADLGVQVGRLGGYSRGFFGPFRKQQFKKWSTSSRISQTPQKTRPGAVRMPFSNGWGMISGSKPFQTAPETPPTGFSEPSRRQHGQFPNGERSPKFRAHVWVASLGKTAPRSFYRKVSLECARPYLPQSGRVEGVLNHSATDSVALSLTFSGVPIPPRPPNRTRLRHRHKRSVSPRRPTSPEQTKRTEQR